MDIETFRNNLNNRMILHYQAIQSEPLVRPDVYAEQLISVAAYLEMLITTNGLATPASAIGTEQITHIAAEMLRYGELIDAITGKTPPIAN